MTYQCYGIAVNRGSTTRSRLFLECLKDQTTKCPIPMKADQIFFIRNYFTLLWSVIRECLPQLQQVPSAEGWTIFCIIIPAITVIHMTCEDTFFSIKSAVACKISRATFWFLFSVDKMQTIFLSCVCTHGYLLLLPVPISNKILAVSSVRKSKTIYRA